MTVFSLSPDSGLDIRAHRPTWRGSREWDARVKLVTCYRIFVQLGRTELIYNHITLRLQPEDGADDDDDPTFLINPFGLTYAEVCMSSLMKIDLQGNVQHTAGQPDWPINPVGFTVHAAVHTGIPGTHRVMRTHMTTGMAVACTRNGLSISNFYAAQLHDRVACHDFEGVTMHANEGPCLVRNIGDKPAVILRNHGLLAWGDSTARAFAMLWLLNRACKIQLVSTSIGPVLEIPETVTCDYTRDSLQFNLNFDADKDVFAALTRAIDHIGSSYRT